MAQKISIKKILLILSTCLSLNLCATHTTEKHPAHNYRTDITIEEIASIRKINISLKAETSPIGSIHLLYDSQSHIGRIQYVRIEQHVRGCGLGKTLMRKALRAFDALGCHRITLRACPMDAEASLNALIRFYENFGFVQKLPDEVGPILDEEFACHMEKTLHEQI